MQVTDTAPDDYLRSLDEPHAETLRTLDELIRSIFADATPEMWEGKMWGLNRRPGPGRRPGAPRAGSRVDDELVISAVAKRAQSD